MVKQYILNEKLYNTGNYKETEKRYQKLIISSVKEKNYNIAALSYNIIGRIYLNKGNYERARNYFEKGLELGKKSKQKSGAGINQGFIGSIYHDLESDDSRKYITDAISLVKESEDDIFKDLVLGHLYTKLGFSTIHHKDSITMRLDYLFTALDYYKKIPKKYFNNNRYFSQTYTNIAMLEYKVKPADTVISHLKKAGYYNKYAETPYIFGFIGTELARNYLRKKDYDSAIYYGNIALKYLSIGTHKQKILETYQYLSYAYENTKQHEQAQQYYIKFKNNEDQINKDKLKSFVQIYKENSTKKDKENFREQIINFFFYFLSALLIIFFILRKKADKISVASGNEVKIEKEVSESTSIPGNKIEEAISYETESQILKRLDKFEDKLHFLQKGITQGKLAAQVDTNVRYLSIVIKKYKAENFNAYLNTLRIKYIIGKLKNDKEYRRYKVRCLADECGYFTVASFTKIFGEITGYTPSAYIAFLNDSDL
ncbi:hypothetical protein ACM40_15855 [Chryseobacterium sp. BLS98]|nr:hypothetical protein ACM40_15855 [Chryseobacterium sp. BLS98]